MVVDGVVGFTYAYSGVHPGSLGSFARAQGYLTRDVEVVRVTVARALVVVWLIRGRWITL